VLRRHELEVLDHDIADPPRGDRDPDDPVGVKGVDMDPADRLVPDDEHAVGPEFEHRLTELQHGSRGRRDEQLNVIGTRP